MAIPFGIYTKYAANVSINALPYYSTPDSTVTVQNSFIGKIYVEDLGTSVYYDVLNTTTGMIVPSNTLPTANYMLHLYPALQIQTTDEICYNSNDGAMHISNPGAANWSVSISGPAGNTTISVAQSDTTITGLMPGSYVVKALSNGVLTSEETAIIHSHAPVVPSFTANTNTEAQNVDIFFTNTSGVNLAFTWDMGDGNSYGSTDAIHQYNTAGSYTVKLTATDDNGCTSSITDAVLITYSAMQNPNTIGQNRGNTIGDPTNNEGTSTESTQKANGENSNEKILINQPEPSIALLTISGTLTSSGDILLEWSTESEKNNSHFSVEKSTNGLTFKEIGRVDGAGNSSQTEKYTFTDVTSTSGTNYYRLKQTDYNGNFKYHNVNAVEVIMNQEGCVLSVFPNPCAGNCTVNFNDCPQDNNGSINLEVIDANGTVVTQQIPERSAEGAFTTSIDVTNNLKPGVYIVRGISSKSSYMQKAVIK